MLTCFITGRTSTGPDDPLFCTNFLVESEADGRRIIEMFDGRGALNAVPGFTTPLTVTVGVLPDFVSSLSILRLTIRVEGKGLISRRMIEQIREQAFNNLEEMHLTEAQRKAPPQPNPAPQP
ncbi:MAG: hypothetical protein PHY92_08060 [Alphaproteobacteria bacterium]|nr:hypothetical protein [Alphaproteobacteria bacterium]